MMIKYNAEIDNQAIYENLHRLINQIYKLLPSREEQVDWQKPLETIIEEVSGMSRLLPNCHNILFLLLCKLEGLTQLTQDNQFLLYRRTIFECLGLIGELQQQCQD